jgi:large subunit ribosomal protein L1
LSQISFRFAKLTKAQKNLNEVPAVRLLEALKLAKDGSKKKFDETIDFQMRLNVDPKHGDQMVRGNCLLPGGLGKKVVIAVLVK